MTRRRRPEPSTSSSQFLFINQDAATITRPGKDPGLSRMVQKHVQRHLRQKLSSNLQSPTVIENADHFEGDTTPRSVSRSASRSPSTDADADYFSVSHTQIEPSKSQDSLLAVRREHEHPYARNIYYDHSRACHTGSEGSSPDLNASLAMLEQLPWLDVSLRLCYKALLKHWIYVLLPQRFSFDTERVGIDQTRHVDAIQLELDEAISQPEHLYSLLASIAVQTLHAPLTSPDCDKIVHLALDLHSKALEAVRAAMDRGVITFGLLRDMQRLLTVAYLTDMNDHASVHFGAMMSMVERVGGLSSFDRYFIENEVIVHWYAGLLTLQAPSIKLSSSMPEPMGFSEFRKQHRTTHQRLRIKLSGAGIDDRYSAAIQDLSIILDFASSTDTADYDGEVTRYISLQHLSVGYRLLAMTTTNTLEEAFRMASIYFVALTRASFEQSCAARSVGKLRATLSKVLGNELDPQLMLWIVTMGGLTAMGTSHEMWFANLAARLQIDLGARSLESMRGHLRMVLYDDRLKGPLERFWMLLPVV